MRTSKTIMQRRIAVLSVAAALLLIIVSTAVAITWGEPDTKHENVGAVMVFGPTAAHPEGEWWQLASGTLIGPHTFLTAGHVTDFLESYPDVWGICVNFAQDPLDFTNTWRYVSAVETHPDYGGPRSNRHDVGVLILAAAVDIDPAILPYEGLLDDLKKTLRQGSDETDFVVVGYGAALDWPPPVATFGQWRQSAESEYQALLPAWLRLSQNQATGDGGTSYGDSGGPAFWSDPDFLDGAEILVGITSWGDVPCVATGFYYRTDIPDTLDFVAAMMAEYP